jgi:RNA polymerase sigma-70 factor (ECF subfamily)
MMQFAGWLSGPRPAPDEPGDEALVARSGKGDQGALTELYDRHAGAILAYLVQLTGDRGAAEELLQDTFVAAWRGADAFEGRAGVRTWLFGIARRRARDVRRRRHLPLADRWDVDDVVVGEGGEEAALARVELDQLGRLAGRLTLAHREVLALVLVHEMPYADVARVLDVPVGTVKSRLNAARRSLRALAGSREEEVDGR